MQQPLFFTADAHEGPVWVGDQCRLYYTTKTHLDGRREVDINFLDLARFNVCDGDALWDNMPDDAPMYVQERLFIHDAVMANSMCLGEHGRSLLVTEQGDHERPSVLSRYNLADKSRTVVLDAASGQPFNSLNKVILTKRGHLIVSDPDYGFRQDFRPPPQLEPAIYTHTAAGETKCFRCKLEMPHGIALTPDECHIFITDTSNDGAHDDDIDLKRHKSVWLFDFDPLTGTISGTGIWCFEVKEGVPDGMVTTEDRLLVGGGDGVYVADLEGRLVGKIKTEHKAVNLALAGGGKHLFVTCDEGVLLLRHWRERVG